jgi:hypothetical protein
MNDRLSKGVWAALFVFLSIAAGVPQIGAVDKEGKFFAYGVGHRSCEDYVKFREKKLDTLKHERYTTEELYEIVDKIVEHWIAGFLTAHNFYVTDTYDVKGKVTLDEVKSRLEKSCRANPKKYFAEVVMELAQELHPNRVTLGSAGQQSPKGR